MPGPPDKQPKGRVDMQYRRGWRINNNTYSQEKVIMMNLRWKCKGCKTQWIYPVKNCIHCGGEISKVIGTKFKVVNLSKISIPSVSHPIVPYYVLILEDEHGNKMPKKTMKEFKIGDEYKFTGSDDMHAVSIIKIKYDIPLAVESAIKLIPEIKIDENMRILVKPSVMSSSYPYLGMATNPEVLDAVLTFLKGRGAKNVKVGEIVQFGEFEAAMKKTEIGACCKDQSVELVDLSKSSFIDKESGGYNFRISKEAMDADLIVNVPVYKTHLVLGISGALENMTRILHPDNVKSLITKDVNNAIYNLHKALSKKQLIVGDLTIGVQGNGPLVYGEPAFLNRVMASHDPVAIDKVFVEMGLLRKSDHVEKCGEEGLGENELAHIPVVGDEIDACRVELKGPVGSRLIKKIM
jgi:uncharacterized protein (DUF362 family)